MKKLNLLFTALMLVCCIGMAKAEEVTIDGIKYDVDTEAKQATVTWDRNYSGDIVIPSEIAYNNAICSVTSIGEDAFYNRTGLTSIVIPNSVTSIGDEAFYGCYGLTSITIPNSVTSIGYSAFYDTAWYNSQPDGVVYAGKVLYEYKGTMPENTSIAIKDGTLGIVRGAFSGCTGLTNITIPNSITSIGDEAFRDCYSLTSIVIPNSVTFIGGFAFLYCTGLTSVEIPNSVTSIGVSAFEGCTGLTNVELPNSVTSIGEYTFYDCKGLTSIEIPNSVTSIRVSAFEGCTGLTSITIPSSVTNIASEAFYGCTGLTSIEIPNSITSIERSAFEGCTGLSSVEFNAENCTYMGDNAYPVFSGCTALSTVTIGENVKTIPFYAFYNCDGLTSVTSLIPADKLFAIYSDVFSSVDKTTCTLYVPYGAKETYAATNGWKAFANIVEMEPVSLHGDINGDGEVNVGDFAALVNLIFNSGSQAATRE